MSEVAMSENDVKVSYNDEFLTLNQITDLTGGHYQTIKKIVEKMVANNDIEMGSVVRKNRTFPAYKLNHKNIAEIQIILKEIKSSSKPVKMNENVISKYGVNATSKTVSSIVSNSSENETVKMNENESNVKIYEVTKHNNELENRIKVLEAENKDLQLAKVNEVSAINNEKVKIESELYKAQADLKLIEDKSKTMESAYAEKKIEVDKLKKILGLKNAIIITLSAVLLIIATVGITILIISRHV